METLGGYLYTTAVRTSCNLCTRHKLDTPQVVGLTPLAAGLLAYKRWRGVESSECVVRGQRPLCTCK